MDEQTGNSLILENRELAEGISRKYAIRNGRHQDEARAEAYFLLVSFFREHSHLYYANLDNYKRTLGIFIKRALIKYFERSMRRDGDSLTTQDKIRANTDEEMIEFLSELAPGVDGFKVLEYLKTGLWFDDVEIVDPLLIKAAKKLRLQVAARLTRLERLQLAGAKITREIKRGTEEERADDCDHQSNFELSV